MAGVVALRPAGSIVARRVPLAVSAALPRHEAAGKPARADAVPFARPGAGTQGCRGSFLGNGKKPIRLRRLFYDLVPERGLEPPLPCENQVLNLARLPIPPFGHSER